MRNGFAFSAVAKAMAGQAVLGFISILTNEEKLTVRF